MKRPRRRLRRKGKIGELEEGREPEKKDRKEEEEEAQRACTPEGGDSVRLRFLGQHDIFERSKWTIKLVSEETRKGRRPERKKREIKISVILGKERKRERGGRGERKRKN